MQVVLSQKSVGANVLGSQNADKPGRHSQRLGFFILERSAKMTSLFVCSNPLRMHARVASV